MTNQNFDQKRRNKLQPLPEVSLKRTLEDQIALRMNMPLELEKTNKDLKKNILMSRNTYELNEKLLVQHLGPNRSRLDMDGAFYKGKKIYLYFYDKIMGN